MPEPKAPDASPPNAVLSPPAVKRVRYQKNFIKTAVCELRFPTLLELESRPPIGFQKKIRKHYPFYEPQIVELTAGDETSREHRYLFRSKDQHWTISVKSFALTIETSKYVDFEDFFGRFKEMFSGAKSMIDADFFTRIGLRYINTIPLQDGTVEGWIRPELIAPLTTGVLGEAKRYLAIIQGEMEDGHFSLRHGMRDESQRALRDEDVTRHESDAGKKTSANVQPATRSYQLDFDYYSENVELEEVESCIKRFNDTNFGLFSWCLGEKAKKLLGEGRIK